jgi:hypothetical protein
MSSHHDPKHDVQQIGRGPGKNEPGKGPKEKEIAATLTAAAVSLARPNVTFTSLEAAGDAVARMYVRMIDLVRARPSREQ